LVDYLCKKWYNSTATKYKGSEIMLEYDEYRLALQNMEENITELRDSL